VPEARDRLDRERVVKTAIDLLDQVGLDGLTLRRLATELGVQAPALYWHFKNKQDLLDHMIATMMRDEAALRDPEPGQAWDAWLADRARNMRGILNRHRDGAMLAASTRPVDSQWTFVERSLEVLVDAGFTPAEGFQALFTIGNYVSGFTLEEQADRVRDSAGNRHDEAAWAEAMQELGPYPLMLTAMQELGDPQSDASFEAGLALLIDGLWLRLQKVGRKPARRKRS
jgi:TetR/AcrR family tetracycline transcriptional repressor